jgi:hypothetical protein
MTKLSVLVAMSAAALAASTASADDKIRAKLIGFQEVPVVSTGATATFEAVISPNGDAIDYELTFSGLQAPIQQSHIHVGQRSVNGGIMIWLCGTGTTQPLAGPPGTQTCPQSGTIRGTIFAANVTPSATATAQQIAAGELNEVIAAIRAGVAYVNIHTAVSPGGEIRGQLRASRREGDRD